MATVLTFFLRLGSVRSEEVREGGWRAGTVSLSVLAALVLGFPIDIGSQQSKVGPIVIAECPNMAVECKRRPSRQWPVFAIRPRTAKRREFVTKTELDTYHWIRVLRCVSICQAVLHQCPLCPQCRWERRWRGICLRWKVLVCCC